MATATPPVGSSSQGRTARALFINEHGSRARGEIRGDQVWIPDWSSGNPYDDGLSGRIRGDRIVWPDGSYWSRRGR